MNRSSFALPAVHLRWVVAGVVLAAILIWGVSLYSIASQIGRPFPGFFYTSDRIVSAFTSQDFTGWQAGLRPWDRIVAVNGQHWREMRRLVREAGIGGTLVYTVERIVPHRPLPRPGRRCSLPAGAGAHPDLRGSGLFPARVRGAPDSDRLQPEPEYPA